MHFIFVLPTTDCECACAHCFYEVGHTPRVAARDYLGPLATALDGLVDEGLQQIIITGGEPLGSPRLAPLVELANRKLLHVLLLTRGDALDEALLEGLEAQGVDDLTLAADDPGPRLRAIVNRVVFRSRYIPTLLCALTRDNAARVDDLLQLADSMNLPLMFTPAYIPTASPRHGELSLWGLDEAGWDELVRRLGPWSAAAGTRGYLAMMRDFYRREPVHPGFCPMGTMGLVVDADGAVYPCFHRQDLGCGNLLDHPWDAIRARLAHVGPELQAAPCFGEHCLSMFAGLRDEPPAAAGGEDR